MDNLLTQYRWQVLFLLLGLIFIGTGLFITKNKHSSSPEIEIISDNSEQTSSKIYVEVAGSVINPGVFELENNSRVDDVLAKAGGFSDAADLSWVEKTINRAAKLTDGQKIYIPNHSETESANISRGSGANSNTLGLSSESAININSASAKELESLWGIGPVTAQNIIDQRPYSSVEELSEKGILKSNVYERNKDKLSIY